MSPSDCFDSCTRALSRLLDGFDVELSGDETDEQIALRIAQKARAEGFYSWDNPYPYGLHKPDTEYSGSRSVVRYSRKLKRLTSY